MTRKNRERSLPGLSCRQRASPRLAQELILLRLVGRRRPAVAVSTESPAHRDGGIKAVRTGGAEIGRAKQPGVTSQIVDLVLGQAHFEIAREAVSGSNRSVISDRLHGFFVADLRYVPPEAESWLEEQEEMARKRLPQGLNLHISAKQVARIGRAG